MLRQGFTHVSDDDYSRTTISELFAHAPRLDPSGTSWLPLPFWVEGSLLGLFGRSLAMSRAVSIVLGASLLPLPYAAMRWSRMPRTAAMVAAIAVVGLPWNAWLSVATVPDGWVGALAAAATIGVLEIAAIGSRGQPVSSRSRYLGMRHGPHARWWRSLCSPSRSARVTCSAALGASPLRAGPSLVDGLECPRARECASLSRTRQPLSPRHRRLCTPAFAEASRVSARSLDRYAGNCGPRRGRPARIRTVSRASPTMGASRIRRRSLVAFLVVGDVGDGAPTHHPARALAMTWWIFAGAGIDVVATSLERLSRVRAGLRTGALGAMGIVATTWGVALPTRWAQSPGRSAWDDRRPQVARGLELRARHVKHVTIVPCQFEHFALLAAWGEPERAVLMPRSGKAPGAECPLVDEGVSP